MRIIQAGVVMIYFIQTKAIGLKSVKKKYKNKNFAAGCSREVIERGAEMLGWDLEDLIVQTIEALRTFRE